MKQNSNNHGGYRSGSGRPRKAEKYALFVRITEDALKHVSAQKNKSEYIEELIRKDM